MLRTVTIEEQHKANEVSMRELAEESQKYLELYQAYTANPEDEDLAAELAVQVSVVKAKAKSVEYGLERELDLMPDDK